MQEKRWVGVLVLIVIGVLSLSLVSASWVDYLLNRITGKAVVEGNNWCSGADMNKDEKVDIGDMGIHSANYGRTDCNSSNLYCNRADINKDKAVDVGDLGILTANYGRTDCAGQININCSLNSDCGISAAINYCSGNLLITNTTIPICKNSGTIDSFCYDDTNSSGVSCPYGCSNGNCADKSIKTKLTSCGILDSANTTYTLQNSITTTGTCFTISANNVTLDMNGYTLTGGGSENGIFVSRYNQTTIKNGNIIKFGNGVYVYSSNNNNLKGIAANNNSNGISFELSSNNSLTGITANSNTIGVYLYSSSNNNLNSITANSNLNTGVYLLRSSNNNNLNSITANSNNRGIWLDLSDDNNLANITTNLNSYGIQLYSNSNNRLAGINSNSNKYKGIYLYSSSNNRLSNITLKLNYGAGIDFSSSSNNALTGITSFSSGIYGLFLSSSPSNTIQNSDFSLNAVYDIFLVLNSTNNTFLNATYSINKEDVASGSQLMRKWHYRAYVNDTSGNNVSGANVSAYKSSNKYQFNLITGTDGFTQLGNIIDYVNNGTRSYYSPYEIYAGMNGYSAGFHTYNADLGNNYKDVFTLSLSSGLPAWCSGADMNKDGKVDVGDLGIYSANIGRADCSAGNSWCSGADMNKDKEIDVGDLGILTANYGRKDCSGQVNINCSDGTFNGNCSLSKPLYCQEGNLFNACSFCGCSSEYRCREDGSCILTKNFRVYISTLKDEYSIGERIELTDPPENNAVTGNIINTPVEDSNANSADYPPEISDTENFQDLKIKGNIIQFEDKPILEKKKEIEKEAVNNERYIAHAGFYNPVKIYKQMFSVMPKDIDKKTKKYSEDLRKKNKRTESRILSALKKSKITGKAIGNLELRIENEFNSVFNGVSLNLSEKEINSIKRVSGVKNVYPDLEVRAFLADSVPLIGADKARQLDRNGDDCSETGKECLTGGNITIAIIDTGIDYNHADLGGCFGANCKVIGGYDFVNSVDMNKDNDLKDCFVEDANGAYCENQFGSDKNNNGNLSSADCYSESNAGNICEEDLNPMDDYGHGTHVASIAAGNGALKGVAPDAKLLAYKVLDSYGSGKSSWIIAGIERAVDPDKDGNISDHADIISMSLGGYGSPDDPMSQAVDSAVDSGVIVVVAAGNSGPSYGTIGSPGIARRAITVGAGDKLNNLALFSSRGPTGAVMKPEILAPGRNICAAQASQDKIRWKNLINNGIDVQCLDDKHISISGTSMAAPHAAGAAALLKQEHPDWNPEEIKFTIMGAATDINESPFAQGKGVVNVLSSVKSRGKYPIAYIESKNSIHTNGEDIKAAVRAFGDNLSGIKISYSSAEQFKSSGQFNLAYESSASLNNETIALPIDESFLESNEHVLVKLEAENTYGTSESYLYLGGSPLLSKEFKLPGYVLVPPKAAKSASNSEKSIIIPHRWLLFSGEDGLEITSFNGDVQLANKEILSSDFSVSDIDSNGEKEVLIYGKQDLVNDDAEKLRVFDFNGKSKAGWPFTTEFNPGYFPVIAGDMNSDGKNEILTRLGKPRKVDNIYNVLLLSSEGQILMNYSNNIYFKMHDISIMMIDANDDGKKEIIGFNPPADRLFAYDSRGQVLEGWPFILPDNRTYEHSRVIGGYLDNDGEKKLLISTYNPYSTLSGLLTKINLDQAKAEWSKNLSIKANIDSLMTADLNGDSNSEIILYMRKKIFIYNNNGEFLSMINLSSRSDFLYLNNIVIADINGDGINELVYAGDKIYFYNLNGSYAEEPIDLGLISDMLFPIIGDFDNNGYTDILVFYNGNAEIYSEGTFRGYLFSLPYKYLESKNAWIMKDYDLESTRCYRCGEAVRHQSKAVNNENINISGNLTIGIQKNVSGAWQDYREVYNSEVIVPANGLIKFDSLFNPLNVFVNETGEYRVYADFLGRNAVRGFKVN